ncbi:hypothetical protein [Ornithinimicrobium cryptoxanthini]|uniref:hypothetical protein n=1 Tax=Ornithinimicrobium cryptoxanthini TaxID=2934161 RepID=UPI002117D056|nr:hypothetical protein [Ornithinimicrobium cryptoxanthini]
MRSRSIIAVQEWPHESRRAAELVIQEYGEPDEVSVTELTWHHVGPWKRVVATEWFENHAFPVPHVDCIECVIDYAVPVEKMTELAQFDGSIRVDRTAGELSVRCRSIASDTLKLNLVHDIVTGQRTWQAARDYHVTEVLDATRGEPTPYRDQLLVPPQVDTKDPGEQILSEAELRTIADSDESLFAPRALARQSAPRHP